MASAVSPDRLLADIIRSVRNDAPVTEVRRGLYWTAVVSRSCGLASTMMQEHCQSEKDVSLDPLTEKSALQLARYALSSDISNASLGLAALNSLIEVDEARCYEINASDLLKKIGRGKNISIIGHFPFVDELRAVAKNLWVIERRLQPGDHDEGHAELFLPQSDIVAISSTTLINHSLAGLLDLCPATSVKMLLGPTTPMAEVLFDYGLDVISGSKVSDRTTVLKYISEGANFRQLKRSGGIKLLTMVRTKELMRV